MGKNKKTTFKVFDYMHCDDFAKYLERMAAKGWYFKEWGAGLKFEKGEPKQVTYAVEVFTKAKETDLRPEPKTKEFAEYCEAAGWKLIDAKQKFCIFQKADEQAVDILTPEERVQNSWKATFSISNIILLILYGLNAILQWGNMFGSMFSYNIFSTMSFFNISAWTFLFLTWLIKLIYAFVVKRKLWEQIKNGQKIYIGNNKEGKKIWDGHLFSILFLSMLFLFLIIMLEDTELVFYFVLVFVATFAFSMILAKVRPDAATNAIIQVVFTLVFCFFIIMIPLVLFSARQEDKENIETVPLFVSDYREVSDAVVEDVSISSDKNMLGSREYYWVFGDGADISYVIYRSKYSRILERIWEEEMEKRKNAYITDCTKEWEAEAAFRNETGDYYVRYEEKVLFFYEDRGNSLTPEQIAIIREKLKLR